MGKALNSIYRLYNNPFILTPIIVEFYSNNISKEKDILLSNLILPIVLFEESRDALQVANSQRSLITFRRKNNNRIFGLQERVSEYKYLTTVCLQHAIANKFIEVTKELSVKVKNKIECDSSLVKSYKASSNLAKMFNNYDIVSIYRLLGIKKL